MTAALTVERALLAGAIDYAGFFPPAQLTLAAAAANYASYRKSQQAWALGRFVAPIDRLNELVDQLELRLACVTVVGTRDVAADVATLHGRQIEVVEAPTPDAAAVRARLAAHPGATVYCELDPGSEQFGAASAEVKRGGGRAKIRTGGVTAAAIPGVDKVLSFLLRCHELDLACKATAGLHHAIRGEYPLTYAPDAPHATMHGYLNLLLAATCLRAGGDAVEARDILACEADGQLWPGRWNTQQISAGRQFLVGFGSCSFQEPLQWLLLH